MDRPFIETPAWIRMPRLVATVRGDRSLEFLQAVLTQDVGSMQPDASAIACYLDEKGHVLAEVRVAIAPGGGVTLHTTEAAREGLEQMARIAPLSACEIEIASTTVCCVRGPFGSDGAAPDGWGGFELPGRAPVGVLEGSASEWTAARIEAGQPVFGVDVTRETLINETPLAERAVSFTKGCYPGQETVAKITNLGKVRKRLVRLRAADDELPPVDGIKVTSQARTAGQTVALGYARAELTGSVVVGGVEVSIEDLA